MPKSRCRKSMVTNTLATVLAVANLCLLCLGCSRDDALRKADVFVDAGLYDEALPILQKAIKEDPSDPKAFFLLGRAELGAGRYADADEAFNRAVKLKPSLTGRVGESYFQGGLAHLVGPDPRSSQEALAFMRIGIEKKPDLAPQAAEAWTTRALEIVRIPLPSAAARSIDEEELAVAGLLLSNAQKVDPHIATDERVLVAMALTTARLPERKKQLETFLSNSPQSKQVPRVLLELARCCAGSNDYEAAVTHLEHLIANFPESTEAKHAKELLSFMKEQRDISRASNGRTLAEQQRSQQKPTAERPVPTALEQAAAREKMAPPSSDRDREEREAKQSEWAARVAASGGPFAVRAFNVDDVAGIWVNDVIVVATKLGEQPDWTSIDDKLRPGENTVTFLASWISDGWSYGFQLKGNDAIIWEDQCGQAGTEGCTKAPMAKQDVFRKDYVVVIK